MTKRFGETFSVPGERDVSSTRPRRGARSVLKRPSAANENAEQMGKTAENAAPLIFLFLLRKQASRPDAGRENGGKLARADAASG